MSYGYGKQNPYDSYENHGPASYQSPQTGGYSPQSGGYSPQTGYGQNSPNAYGEYNHQSYGAGHEMAPLAHNAGPVASGNSDPNAILNECRDIDQDLNALEKRLEQLRVLQRRTLDDTDSASTNAAFRNCDNMNTEILADMATVKNRLSAVMGMRESKSRMNAPHIKRVEDRRVSIVRQHTQIMSSFMKDHEQQVERQYRLVNPNATNEEVRDVVQNAKNGGQIFAQALMQSDRMGHANTVLANVKSRHEEFLNIERSLAQLAELMQATAELVEEQEPMFNQIEEKAEEVTENLGKGNEEIAKASETARATRKKKWWCLGICVLIVVIIAVIVAIYFAIIKPGGNDNKKRSIVDDIENVGTLPVLTARKVSRVMGRKALNNPEIRSIVENLRQRAHTPRLTQ